MEDLKLEKLSKEDMFGLIGELKAENAVLRKYLNEILERRLVENKGSKIASSEYSLLGVKDPKEIEKIAGVKNPEEVTMQVSSSLADKIRRAKDLGLIVCMTDTIKSE